MIEEFKDLSQAADNIISSTLQTSLTSDICICCNTEEEKFDIITVALTSFVPESIETFQEYEELPGANK